MIPCWLPCDGRKAVVHHKRVQSFFICGCVSKMFYSDSSASHTRNAPTSVLRVRRFMFFSLSFGGLHWIRDGSHLVCVLLNLIFSLTLHRFAQCPAVHVQSEDVVAKSEHTPIFDLLVGIHIHMSKMNMPLFFLRGITSPVFMLLMRG